jgi:hypothetical protein
MICDGHGTGRPGIYLISGPTRHKNGTGRGTPGRLLKKINFIIIDSHTFPTLSSPIPDAVQVYAGAIAPTLVLKEICCKHSAISRQVGDDQWVRLHEVYIRNGYRRQ